jgi:hypothetical protein
VTTWKRDQAGLPDVGDLLQLAQVVRKTPVLGRLGLLGERNVVVVHAARSSH